MASVGVAVLVYHSPHLESVDYSKMTHEELLEHVQGEETPIGESLVIGLVFVGMLFGVIEGFGWLFARFAGSVSPPPPPIPDDDDL